jgi:hypothetical protein
MGEITNACKIIVGKFERGKSLQRPSHRRRDIKIYLKEIVLTCVIWIQLAEAMVESRALVNAAVNFQII